MLKVLVNALKYNNIKFKKILYAADWNKSSYRLALQPDYKGHREKVKAKDSDEQKELRDSFLNDYSTLFNIFDSVGYNIQSKASEVEADDAMMLVRYLDEESNILLISLDEDWYYQINSTGINRGNTHLLKYSKNELYTTKKQVEELYGLPVDVLPHYSAIVGQKKDNILGLVNMAKARFKKHLLDLPMEEWWTVLEELISSNKYKLHIHPQAKHNTIFQQYHHNLLMMSPMPLDKHKLSDINFTKTAMTRSPNNDNYEKFIRDCIEYFDTFPTISFEDYKLLKYGNSK
jgi:5'-3' exonuclease